MLLRCPKPATRQVLDRIRAVMDIHNATPDTMPVFLSFGPVNAIGQTSINKPVALADKKMMAEKAKNRPVNRVAVKQWTEAQTGVPIDVSDTRLDLR